MAYYYTVKPTSLPVSPWQNCHPRVSSGIGATLYTQTYAVHTPSCSSPRKLQLRTSSFPAYSQSVLSHVYPAFVTDGYRSVRSVSDDAIFIHPPVCCCDFPYCMCSVRTTHSAAGGGMHLVVLWQLPRCNCCVRECLCNSSGCWPCFGLWLSLFSMARTQLLFPPFLLHQMPFLFLSPTLCCCCCKGRERERERERKAYMQT